MSKNAHLQSQNNIKQERTSKMKKKDFEHKYIIAQRANWILGSLLAVALVLIFLLIIDGRQTHKELLLVTSSKNTQDSQEQLSEEEEKTTINVSEASSEPQQAEFTPASDVEYSFELSDNALQKLSDKAIELYLNDEWDGTPTILNGHDISLNEEGCLLIDKHSSKPSKFHCGQSIDVPASVTHLHGEKFMFGEGVYTLSDNTLIRYSKGKAVKLDGGKLTWEGIDLTKYRPYDYVLFYDELCDRLFLLACSIPFDLTDKSLQDGVGVYLYVIPDRTKSEMFLVSEILDLDFCFDMCNSFSYTDTSNIVWEYTIQPDGSYAPTKLRTLSEAPIPSDAWVKLFRNKLFDAFNGVELYYGSGIPEDAFTPQ